MNDELLLRAIFNIFNGHFFLHFSVCSKWLLDTKVKKTLKNFGEDFFLVKNCGVFRANYNNQYYSSGCLSATP